MIITYALVMLVVSKQPQVTLTAWDFSGRDLKVVRWASLDAGGSHTYSVPIDHSQRYQWEGNDWRMVFTANEQATVVYAEKQGAKGILIVRRSGSVAFVPVSSQVRFLEFIDDGANLLATYDKSSQIFSTSNGFPTVSSGLDEHIKLEFKDRFSFLKDLNQLSVRSAKIPASTTKIAQFSSLINSVVNFYKTDPYRAGSGQATLLDGTSSPDSRYWFQRNLREFIGEGNHDYMKFLGADGLFSLHGLEWQWKTGLGDFAPSNYDPPCYVNPTKIAFLVRQRFIMGRPGDPKFYPPGLYTLDLKTWKPVRQPLSSRLLNKKYENYHLVSYHL